MLITSQHLVAVIAEAVSALAVPFRGRWPERIGFFMLAASLTLWPLCQQRSRWDDPQLQCFLVDLALCIGFLILAIRCERAWSILCVSIQLIAVCIYIIYWQNRPLLFRSFYYEQAVISYMIEGAIITGCLLEGRPDRLRSS